MLLYFVTGDNAQIRLSISGTAGIVALAIYGAGQVLKGSGASASGAIAVNHATHVAITRSGDTYTLYCDGVQSAQFTATGVSSAAGSSVQLNLGNLTFSLAAAYYTNFRVTEALRYSGAFTPVPTYASGDPNGSQVYRIQTEQMYATFAANKNDERRGEPTITGVNAGGVNVINNYAYPWGNGNALYMPDSATVRWGGVANLAAEPVFEVSFFSILDTLATHVLFHSSCADGSSVTIYHLITPQLSVTFKDRTGAIKLQIDADNGLGGLSTTAFHKVALTRNGTQAKLYVDDTLVGSGTIPAFDASRIPGYVLLGSNDTTGKAYANLRVDLTNFVHDPLAELSYAPETNRQPDIFQPLTGTTALIVPTVILGGAAEAMSGAAATLDVVSGGVSVDLAASVAAVSTATGALGVTVAMAGAPVAVATATGSLGVAVSLSASVSAVGTASASAANAVQLAAGVAGDPFWSQVGYSNHFDTSITGDEQGLAYLTTDAVISSAQSKFGGSSAYFDGTKQIQTDGSTPSFLNCSDFTVDGWIRPDSAATGDLRYLIGCGIHDFALYLKDDGLGYMVYVNGSAYDFTDSASYFGVWTHVAVVRVSGVTSLYVNGVSKWSASLGDTLINGRIAIGRRTWHASAWYTGYVDDLRVTNAARWTSNFTPPTAAYITQATPVGSVSTASASLMRGVELSTSTPGDPYWDNVVFASHFDGTAGTTAWDDLKGHTATTYNGAVLASGGEFGNCLSAEANSLAEVTWDLGTDCNLGNGLWTVELAYNAASPVASKWLWELGRSGSDGIGMYCDAGNNVFLMRQGIPLIGVIGSTVADGAWHLLAVQHAGGGVYEFYVDGAKSAYTTGGTTYYFSLPDNVTLAIGGNMTRSAAGSQAKFDEFRVTKGVARYSGNFTPPATAFLGAPSYVSAVSVATADLSAVAGSGSNVTMDAAVAAVASATGAITNTTPLAASASASASVSGALAQAVPLAASGAAQAGSSGTVVVAVALASSASCVSAPSAGLAVGKPLVASTAAVATGSVAASLTVPLACSAVASASVIAAVNSKVNLLAGVAAVSNIGGAALALATPLAASTSATAAPTASLVVGANVQLSTGNVGDPYWIYVNLLLRGDGTNGSTTITDSSSVAKSIAVFGNAQISTAQSKFGGSSIAFDGTGDYLQNTDGGWASGTLDFTVEGWVYANSLADYGGIFSTMRANPTGFGHTISLDKTTGNIIFAVSDGATYSAYSVSSSPVTTGAWHHIAGVRNGNTFTTFLDGTSVGSFTSTGSMINTNAVVGETYNDSNVNSLNGYIDDLRVTIGVARYTSNFSVPTAAFPDGANSVVGAEATASATLTVTAGSGSASLASAVSAAASATAALTDTIPLAASVAAVATPNATLATASGLSTTASAVATATAGLAATKPLAGAVSSVATGTGALTDTVNLATSAAAISTTVAAINSNVALLAGVAAVANIGSASLTDTIPLAAASVAVATPTATLAETVLLATSVGAVATPTANLTSARALASSVGAVFTSSAAINIVAPLAASVQATATATATLGSTALTLGATATATSTVSAGLLPTVNMGAGVAAVSTTAGAVANATALVSAAIAQAQASSWLALNLQLTAVAQAVASVIGDVYATTPASWLTGVRRVYLHSEAYAVAQTIEVRGVLVPLDFTYVMVPPDDHAVYIASEKTTA